MGGRMTEKEGNNTIKLSVYFHTSGAGVELRPKTAFKSGWVQMPTNHKHGIRASDVKPIYFGSGFSQGNLLDAIKACLKANKINFIDSGKVKDYKKFLEMQKKEEFFDNNGEL
ncbi:MAG: hypothetical protein Q8P05_02950 [Candidatus Diapherotrites archaeon]|nr:hypothetical protein [Candidatus Diapherotrites archaeon]